MKTGQLKTTLHWKIPDGRPRHVVALAFHPNGKTLAAGGHIYDKKLEKTDNARFRFCVVWVWDLDSGTGKLLTTHVGLKEPDTRNVN